MDLIARYLVAVRRHLPQPLQQDVVEELADNLRSQAEDQEHQLGRPLSAADHAELLKKHGHPWLVASRYLPQQYLIGPALYPYYRQALVMVLFWIVLPLALGGGALRAIYADDASRVWGWALGAAWNGSLYAIGIVTSVFYVLEKERVRFTALDHWDPSSLPEPSGAHAVPRSESLISLIFSTTFLLWWADLLRVPAFLAGNGETVRFAAEPIWTAVFVPILVSLVLTVAMSLVDLIRPWRTTLVSLLWVALDVGNVIIAGIVLRAGHWVTIFEDAQDGGNLARADYWANQIVEWSLYIVIVICVFDALHELWKVMKARRELSG